MTGRLPRPRRPTTPVYSPSVRIALLLALLFMLPATAQGVENAGAGASMGLGAAGYYPAPRAGFRLNLPALELAAAPGGVNTWQLRVRLPLLNTIYAAGIRQQLDLQADVYWLRLGMCDCPVGSAKIRPLAGPMVGARLNIAPGVAQPGIALGGRFGAEYVGPGRRLGVTVAAEPFFELRGGSAGLGRTSVTTGGGALLVLALTGYQAP